MSESFSQNLLGGLRLAVGLLSLTSPGLAARAFGIDPDMSSGWVTRLFGSRELALAAALLAAPGDQVPTVARIGAYVDTADLASSVVEFARGRISVYSLVSGGGGAALFALLGLAAARRAVQAEPTNRAQDDAGAHVGLAGHDRG